MNPFVPAGYGGGPGNGPACEPASLRPLEQTAGIVQRGSTALVMPGATDARDAVPIFDTRVMCSIGEIIAIVFSVDSGCGLADDDMAFEGVDPRDPMILLRAKIVGGLGGMKFTVTIDIRHGTVFALPTESVAVSAYALVVPPPGIAASEVFCPSTPFLVGAGVGYGCGREFARLTEPIRVAAGGQGRVPLPAFASRFALVPAGATTMQVQAVTSGSPPYPTYAQTGPTPTPQWYPIPAGTRGFYVDGAGGAAEGFLLFGLDL